MKQNQVSVLCIGAAHIDYKFIPYKSIIKQTSNPVKTSMNYGGVVRNVAENLARLNIDVSLMSVLGDDLLGRQLIEEMSHLMKTNHLQQLKNQRTGQYYAVLDHEGDMEMAFADMSIYDSMNADWMIHQLANAPTYDYYVADMNVQKSALNVLIHWTNTHHNKLIIVGVSEPKMANLPKNLKDVFLLICNQKEARALFDQTNLTDNQLIESLKSLGIKHVILTNGIQPIIYIGEDKVIYHNINHLVPNEMIDTTGAGDAFSAGVIFGLIHDKSILEALNDGVANASLVIKSKDSVRQDLNIDILFQEVVKNE
jgi:sugar/nucleoside kinase (ribokinase family)